METRLYRCAGPQDVLLEVVQMWVNLLGIFLLLDVVRAETATWEQLIASGDKVRTEARYTEAEPYFRSAIQQAQGPEERAMSLGQVALLLQLRGAFPQAEEFYQRAISAYEVLPSPLNLAINLNTLGNLYANEGRCDQAEPLVLHAIEIQSRVSGPESAGMADMLDTLASIQMNRSRYADAEDTFRRVASLRERLLGPEDPGLAETLSNLGRICHTLGRYSEAEALDRRAIRIREKALGTEHPDVAHIRGQFGQHSRPLGHPWRPDVLAL